MRSRLFALSILVLIVGIPVFIYWYFFTKNTASLTINILSGGVYSVELKGAIDNENLPLADRIISLKKECGTSCVFAPIAPIRYDMILTSTGKTQIQESLVIPIGEDITRTYELQDDIAIAKTVISALGSPDIANAIMANAQNKDPDYLYSLVGIDRENIVYAERISSIGKRELGILSLEKFSPLWIFPDGVGDMLLDVTGGYFIAPLFADKTVIMNRKLNIKKEIPLTGVLGYVGGKEEKVLTKSGIILGIDSSYGKNPRYSDWLDISATLRLGYIDKDDTDKLALSHYPEDTSILILHDRVTGETTILKRGVDITFLFFLSEVPVFFDKNGILWALDTSSLL